MRNGAAAAGPGNVEDDSSNAIILRQAVAEVFLDRDSTTPLRVQLKNALSEKIGKDALKPDARLPSEQATCEIFNVSRPVGARHSAASRTRAYGRSDCASVASSVRAKARGRMLRPQQTRWPQ